MTRSRTLGVSTLLCAGLLGLTRLGLTQDTQLAPATDPKAVTDAKANPALQDLADVAAKIEIPDLSEADEKTVREEWEKLQKQLEEVEIAYPAKAIELYEQFMNGGAIQYGDVAMEVVLRVGGLYYTELQNYEAAVKTYDWGLNAYPKFPAARQVQEFRVIAAAKAQGRAPEIPTVGFKAPQANKTQLKPAQVKETTGSPIPLPSVKIDSKVVSTTKSVGQVKIPVQPNEAKVVGATKAVGRVKIAVPSNQTPVAKVGEVKALNTQGIGTAKTQLPLALVLPKAGATTADKTISIQTAIKSVDVVKPSLLLEAGVNEAQRKALGALSPVASVPPSLATTARPGNYGGWKTGLDRCVTALARQKSGRLWVATEDSGVWYYDEASPTKDGDNASGARPISSRWKQFAAKDGLGGDSAYALAVDKQDRVWVGTLNHGVSVWNGKSWKNYGVLDGPLGERVFDIAVGPVDGDVWMATNAGLTRYSPSKDNWSYFTKADGLPSNEIQAVAFDKVGNLIIGSRCDGVALASVSDNYRKWQVVTGLETPSSTPTGQGLPSNLINDVLVAHDGIIYVATVCGLAWSRDAGVNWSYVRGRDYAAKIKGLYAGPPKAWKEESGTLLMEDYVSCLAEDESGQIWLGHWQEGHEVLDRTKAPGLSKETTLGSKNIHNLSFIRQERSGFVRAILPVKQGQTLVARYDEGISSTTVKAEVVSPSGRIMKIKLADSTSTNQKQLGGGATAGGATNMAFPKVASPPTEKELESLLQRVKSSTNYGSKFNIVSLSDDWTTQGDWLGRYGRHFAVLCAMNSPMDYVWGAGSEKVQYDLSISPKEKGNSIRYWVHWLHSSQRQVLEMPPVYGDSRRVLGLATEGQVRRQSEVDDNGEAYPLTKEGPNIYASLKIPTGDYMLSFYNANKDGEFSLNRLRDYKISLRDHPANVPLEDVSAFDTWPELARNRQVDFRGGVYQRYLVRGPRSITVEYARNNSVNTILTGIFLDKVDERSGGQEPEPYFNQTVSPPTAVEPNLPEAVLVSQLWDALEAARTSNPTWWASERQRFYAPLTRWHEAARSSADIESTPRLIARLGSCHYYLNSFPKWEETQRQRNLIPARDIESSLRFDETTIKSNGSQNFSGRGRKTVRAYLSRLQPVPSNTDTATPVQTVTSQTSITR